MSCIRNSVGQICLILAAAVLARDAGAVVTKHTGVLSSPAIAASFVTATADHMKKFIDFDDDGFRVSGNNWEPIPENYYAALGVTLINLDAKAVSNPAWTHSPPVGAWHSGFSDTITTPYSFVFTSPVASFGMFANDLENPMTATVYMASGTERFGIPAQGGAHVGQFHGFTAPSNIITRIDFTTGDYHVIDDVQFGILVPEPGTGMLVLCMVLCAASRRM